MLIKECERKCEYRNMEGNGNTGMQKEMGIQECERKWEYRNVKGNGNTGT
jgi:hypothetical protein